MIQRVVDLKQVKGNRLQQLASMVDLIKTTLMLRYNKK